MVHLPSDRVLAFVDILGFQALVKRMETEPALYDLVSQTLDQISRDLNKRAQDATGATVTMGYEGYCYPLVQTMFSDSVVISAERELPRSYENVLYAVSTLHDRLLMKGIFMRGGIAVGWAKHDANIVFGKAMIGAYRLESEASRVPRVVLSEVVANHIRASSSGGAVRRDSDGLWYSKPFQHLWFGDQVAIPDPDQLNHARSHITDALQRAQGDHNLTSKFRWIAGRFNEHIQECREGMWAHMPSIVAPLPIEF